MLRSWERLICSKTSVIWLVLFKVFVAKVLWEWGMDMNRLKMSLELPAKDNIFLFFNFGVFLVFFLKRVGLYLLFKLIESSPFAFCSYFFRWTYASKKKCKVESLKRSLTGFGLLKSRSHTGLIRLIQITLRLLAFD